MTLAPTASAAEESPLTAEQRQVAELPMEARALVTAGAGTGKTRVLIDRLQILVQRDELSPGQEVLVLSFSRAAVAEIRRRLALSGGGAAYVRASTFDAFATRLLALTAPDGPWQREGYEGRIRLAAELLAGGDDLGDLPQEVATYRHILVDEIQDLVGQRAELVKAILQRWDCGFTVFGDPAQGIYNFQLEDEARRLGSGALFEWVREVFGRDLVERAFAENFRAHSEIAKRALWAGPKLSAKEPDYPGINERLESLLYELPSAGTLASALPMFRSPNMQTAVLCRTNGEALLVSRELAQKGIPHRLQRRADDRAIAPWLGRLSARVGHGVVSRSRFLELVAEMNGDTPPADEAWRWLKRLDRRSGPDLDLTLVADRIRLGDVPDDLLGRSVPPVVVSTIHRAKGLEFERVVLVRSADSRELGEMEVAEETRVLYVALTRSRSDQWILEPLRTYGLHSRDDFGDRWVRKVNKWRFTDIEVRPEDVHKLDPAGTFLLQGLPPDKIQDHLWGRVGPGQRVTLRRIAVTKEGQPRVHYAIEHDVGSIGITNEGFGRHLFGILKIHRKWQVNWPVAIEDLFVEGIDTVAGSAAAGMRAGLGESGMWVRVRISGLGKLVFQPMGER